MIKITIIIILILLLLITLYSYYCLSSGMINFQRDRLEYILQKQAELKKKETELTIISNCSNKNKQYERAIDNINKIILELDINNKSNINTFEDIEKIISEKIILPTYSEIFAEQEQYQDKNQEKINSNLNSNPESDSISINSLDMIVEQPSDSNIILDEVPMEYITY